MIRVGVVGIGTMGLTHLDVYRRRSDVTVTALCDIDPDRLAGRTLATGNIEGQAQQAADDLAGARRYERADALFADDEVDVVDVCTPTDLHVEHATAALAAGRHVIVEKPLARSSTAGARLVEAAARAPGTLFVAQCMRYWPGWSWAKAAIDDGRYGRVLAATFRRVVSHPGGPFYESGDRCGGAILDLHIHDTDFIAHCFGPPRSVTTFGYARITDQPDHVVTRYEYDDVPLVVAEGSWALAAGSRFRMGYTLNFERATATYDSAAAEPLTVVEAGTKPRAIDVDGRMGYEVELDDFLRCVREGEKPTVVTPDGALESVRIVEAEARSLAMGRSVTIG